MADPTVTFVTSGTSALASVVVSFSAQPAGTLLVLSITAEAYRSGNPSGWTLIRELGTPQWMGCIVWYKIATGSETSVTYVIGSAAGSAYTLHSADNIDGTTPLDVSNINNSSTAMGSTNTFTGATATSGSGRKLGLAIMHRISDVTTTGMGSLTNSFTQHAAVSRTTTDRPAVVVTTRIFDGPITTGTGGTWAPTSSDNHQFAGIVAFFNVASSGSFAVSGTVPITIGASATVQKSAPVSGTVPIVIGTSAAPKQSQPVAGTVPIVIGATGAVGKSAPVSGTVPIVIDSSLTVGLSGGGLAVSGTVPIVIGATATAGQRQAISGTVAIVIGTSLTATLPGSASGTVAITIGVSGTVSKRAAVSGTVPIVIGVYGSAFVPGDGTDFDRPLRLRGRARDALYLTIDFDRMSLTGTATELSLKGEP